MTGRLTARDEANLRRAEQQPSSPWKVARLLAHIATCPRCIRVVLRRTLDATHG